MSGVGGIVWQAPLFAVLAIVIIGDRGPFRRFHSPRGTVELTNVGLSWATQCAGRGRMDWDEIGGVSQLGSGTGTLTIVYDPQGVETVTIEGRFRAEDSRRRYPIPMAVAALKPQIFEAVDPRHPEKGCVRRVASVSGEPRSVP